MGYIYILTSPSGKSYIGQTIRPIEKRFKAHKDINSGCIAIRDAIKKYEWENFKIDWYECPDEDLNFDEELLVREMGTLSPDGYNLKEGGGNGKLSEETKQKMSEAHIGVLHTEESKQKMSEANLGKVLSEETKQKIGEAQLGDKNHNSKRVYQYDLGGTLIASFGSCKEAGRHVEGNGSAISKCARGVKRYKTAYGFVWKYENVEKLDNM